MTVSTIIATTTIAGAIQSLPKFDETNYIIVTPAPETANNRTIYQQTAYTTAFPYTIENRNKLSEFQILKPEDTKQLGSINGAALKELGVPDYTHKYANEIMKAGECDQKDKCLRLSPRKFQVQI